MELEMIVKQKLINALEYAATEAQKKGILVFTALPEIIVEHPQNVQHGDYASSLPLKLVRMAELPPMTIAEKIIEFLPQMTEVSKVIPSKPGFINFVLNPSWLSTNVAAVLQQNETFGAIDAGSGKTVQIEFVSGNPTGPLHVGHGRGAVLGSTLANVLACAGFNVQKEYYINDAGSQLNAFYRTLNARYQQALNIDAEVPQDGYMGTYMVDLAKELVAESGDKFIKNPDGMKELGSIGVTRMMTLIENDLRRLGVEFDNWFSERSLFDSGLYSSVMKLLRDKGHVADRENATWFSSAALGEDKDNVLVRSDGTPTYFASDIAYHYNKFVERKFDKVIDIWGADHQGHVSRMKTVLSALDIDPERLTVLICQLVTLKRGEEIVRVSKRSGDLITLDDVIDEVGADACRFFFLSRSADSQMDFDLELAVKQTADNPVYYVQYAHARICSIMRLAQEQGIDYTDGDVSLLTHESEQALIKQMVLLPEIIDTIARTLEPHHLTYYAQDLATAFHSFYKLCRVVSADQNITHARLKLVKAAQIVLARTLHLMGMSAPETM